MTDHEHVAEDKERLRIYVTGNCDGLAEVLQALQAHDELELVGAAETIQEAASALAGGHLDAILHATRGPAYPASEVATIREFRVDSVDDFEVGQTVSLGDLFTAGDEVDVTGVSKGKGFAGHIKRHNFARGPKSHGSDHHREPGSIGPGTTPGRVYKGVRMAGHMGDERVTTKKVRVVKADGDRNLLLLAGSLPGARGGLILVRKA